MDIEFDNNIPIYIQIEKYLEYQIIRGILKPNDKLPSVREYALMYKVNPNTIQKSLVELENKGLIITKRTTGKYVVDNNELILSLKKLRALEKINTFINEMHELGVSNKEIISYINKEEK